MPSMRLSHFLFNRHIQIDSNPCFKGGTRLRKEKGYTQAELADRIGIIRELISNYERQRIRPNYEMVTRLASALEVTTDELLGVKPSKSNGSQPSLKIQRRMKKIVALPESQQKFILKTIDSHLKALEK